MPQVFRFTGLIVAVLALTSNMASAAEADHLDTCLEVASAQYSEAVSAATQMLHRDTSRCAGLPSIEVKQSCSNQAFEAFEHAKAQAQVEYRANVSACTR